MIIIHDRFYASPLFDLDIFKESSLPLIDVHEIIICCRTHSAYRNTFPH